ncbi:hypothetical protein COLO4_16170 [Corchorus olitorius]|uniref:Uncharacterized protein n=1 Tax=Corchorus olitorius TaxID=93759 RepID=A0A1R3JIY4_9ROSI|nr:hypothetical protein COLO4_16170 [Corchorus olitorius]
MAVDAKLSILDRLVQSHGIKNIPTRKQLMKLLGDDSVKENSEDQARVYIAVRGIEPTKAKL